MNGANGDRFHGRRKKNRTDLASVQKPLTVSEHPHYANTSSCGAGVSPATATGRAGCPPHKNTISAKVGCTLSVKG